jgi:hypothetical protein
VPINPAKTPASVAAPTIPAAAAFSGNTFLISAVILLSGACLFLLATRHRVPPQKVSLITRSMDPGQS